MSDHNHDDGGLIATNEDGSHIHLPSGLDVVVAVETPGGGVFRQTIPLASVGTSETPALVLLQAFNHVLNEYVGTLVLQQSREGEPDVDPLVETPDNPFDPAYEESTGTE